MYPSELFGFGSKKLDWPIASLQVECCLADCDFESQSD